MLKLRKVINQETKLAEVALSDTPDEKYFLQNGFSWGEVELSYNGNYYEQGYAPIRPEREVIQEQILELERQQTARLYREANIDLLNGLTSSYAIDKLKEIDAEITELRAKL